MFTIISGCRGKCFTIQGQGLSMLILMSMMVAAATICPSHVKGFGFKKHITTNEVQTI